MKRKYLSIFFITTIFLLATPVLAGGFHVELTPENIGNANSNGVGVEIYTGTLDRVTAFNIGYNFHLKFSSPTDNQKCIVDKPTSDDRGLAHGVCFSDIPGEFEIHPEVQDKYNNEWNFLRDIKTTIRFNGDLHQGDSVTPDTREPNGEKDVNTQELEEKIADLEQAINEQKDNNKFQENKTKQLEQKLANQQEEISALRKVINKIVEALSSLWPFN